MSRIGKSPISLPKGVTIEVSGSNVVKVKGPKGELFQAVDPDIAVKVDNGVITVERPTEQKRHKALHGTYRALINNMVKGVSDGYTAQLELVGVGYRAKLAGKNLEFTLGFSHPIVYPLPEGITAAVPETTQVILTGSDRQQVGQVAAQIRGLRPPEPYKGKGVLYKGEKIRRKAGKSGGK